MAAAVNYEHHTGEDRPEVGTADTEDDLELERLFAYWKKQPPGKVKWVSLKQLDQDNNCHRCGKKVYPVEKLDIGVLYHKACFKCLLCSRQLTLQNFQREIDPAHAETKEVYCNVHVPRQGHGVFDQDALGIRSAIDAQRRTSKKVHRHVYPEHSFIPDFPQRGSGDWSTGSSAGSGSRQDSGQWDAASQEPEVGDAREVQEAVHSVFLPVEPADASCADVDITPPDVHDGVAADAFPVLAEVATAHGAAVEGEQSDVEGRRQVLLRRQESASQRNSTIRRRSTLRSFQDFEKFGVFDAQSMLEKCQRQEEDELYTQIETERRSLRKRLEDALRSERDASVRDLVAFFETNGVSGAEQRDALVKVEEYYRRRREAALRELLARLAAEEQAAVARMVEKHSNEMIQLIRKKERIAIETLNRPATSCPLPVPKEDTTTAPSTVLPVPARAVDGASGSTGTETGTSTPISRSPASAFSTHGEKNSSNTPGRVPGVMHITPIIQRVSSPKPRHPLPSLSMLSIHGESDNDINFAPLLNQNKALGTHHSQKDTGGTRMVATGVQEEDDDSDLDSMELSEAIPEVEPPTCRKGTLYTDPDVFLEQDRCAIKESKKDHKTFTDLIRQLSKRCQTELQKVRAIFRWVTVKDLNRMKFDERVDPNSPLGLLRGIKTGTESYHDLFRRLCSYAGLHCEIIEGYSKGAGYRPGDSIQGEMFRNQWTAVWVDGSWRFINCKWGARHVKATRDTSLTYKCDEFYFLTDPEDHIYQHFPDDPMWQLLPEPLRMNDFMRLPVLKSPFFNHGLQLARPYGAILKTQDGQTEVRLRSEKLFGVAAKLKSTNKEIPTEILAERTLVRYVENQFVIMVNLPSPGTYFLDIFAASEWDSDRMDNACAFQLCCSGISRNADMTYPPIGCFGRTPSFTECGLTEETHNDPYITPSGGVITVMYNLTKNVSLKPTLRRWDPRDGSMMDYDRYVLFRQRTSHVAMFDLQLPRRGLYVFSTYVVHPEDAAAAMVCLYRHLIDCTAPHMDAAPYPKASKRFKHCRVVEPLTGDLSPETEVTFVLESRCAVDMMVVFNNKSHNLKVNGKVWRKTVYLNVPTGKVMVYARFEPSSEKYIPLLEYQIANTKKYSYLS